MVNETNNLFLFTEIPPLLLAWFGFEVDVKGTWSWRLAHKFATRKKKREWVTNARDNESMLKAHQAALESRRKSRRKIEIKMKSILAEANESMETGELFMTLIR